MLVCYIDESGDEQALVRPDSPPVLALAGLVVAESNLKDLIWDFLAIKKKFENSALTPQSRLSDVIRHEIKGSNLRADIRIGRRRSMRRAIGILDAVMQLMENRNVQLAGYITVKSDQNAPRRYVYSDAVAWIATQFEAQMAAASTNGIMILDARTKSKNINSVHVITTRQFKSGGAIFPHLTESPLFGHSDGHVVLQLADIVASALLFPIACYAFCADLSGNAHTHQSYRLLQSRYGERLRRLEHRYLDSDGVRRGGLRVVDHRNQQETRRFFG